MNTPLPLAPAITTAPSTIVASDAAVWTLDQDLPGALLSVLERRYLADYRAEDWRPQLDDDDPVLPSLREVEGLGESGARLDESLSKALASIHAPGHAVVWVAFGDGARHRVFVGGRRSMGSGAGSASAFLAAQAAALGANLPGIRLSEAKPLDGRAYPELDAFLASAPGVRALGGVPGLIDSSKDAAPGMERIVAALGSQRYALVLVAQALDPAVVDATIDAARRLKDEIHRYVRVNLSRNRSEGESTSRTETSGGSSTGLTKDLPFALMALNVFATLSRLSTVAQALQTIGVFAASRGGFQRQSHEDSVQVGTSAGTSEGESVEVRNSVAEACEAALDGTIARLEEARNNGCWVASVTAFGETEATVGAAAGAWRALTVGDARRGEPLRALELPPTGRIVLREAARRGQVPRLLPSSTSVARGMGHPLGSAFDTLGTLLTSRELAALPLLPREEIPGLPMRRYARFGQTAPTVSAGVELGTLRDALGRDLTPLRVGLGSVNRHALVVGLIGSGKTTTCMQLLLQAHDAGNGLPFLVVEPKKTEYRELAGHPLLRAELAVYGIADPSVIPLQINPFDWVEGFPLERHVDYLKAVFMSAFAMFPGMDYVLVDAIRGIYEDFGWNIRTSTNDALGPDSRPEDRIALLPRLSDLQDKIESVLKSRNYGQEIHQNLGAALRSRVGSLLIGSKGQALNSRKSTPLVSLFEGPTIIELQGLSDDDDKAFVMAAVFVLLCEHAEMRRRSAGFEAGLRHVTLIEEAHRLLRGTRTDGPADQANPRGKAVSMFTDMMAEMRAYGEGFVVADQIPTNLAADIVKNSNLKIVHRLTSVEDRMAVGNAINLTEAQNVAVNELRKGEAIVHAEEISPAVLIRVANAKTALATLKAPRREIPGELAWQSGLCRGCGAPCVYVSRGERLREAGAGLVARHALGGLLYSDAPWTSPREGQDGESFCASTLGLYAALEEAVSLGRGGGVEPRPASARLAIDRGAALLGECLKGSCADAAGVRNRLRTLLGASRETLLADAVASILRTTDVNKLTNGLAAVLGRVGTPEARADGVLPIVRALVAATVVSGADEREVAGLVLRAVAFPSAAIQDSAAEVAANLAAPSPGPVDA